MPNYQDIKSPIFGYSFSTYRKDYVHKFYVYLAQIAYMLKRDSRGLLKTVDAVFYSTFQCQQKSKARLVGHFFMKLLMKHRNTK